MRDAFTGAVISCLALAVALSGVGYAAVVLPKNSVGTRQLKANAVVPSKVKNGGLKAIDFAAGQLPTGQQGPPGPTGPPWPTAAAVSVGGAEPPAATNTSGDNVDIVTTTITTTTPGKLLVGANLSTLFSTGGGIEIEPGVICDPHGACGLTFGVYLDGIPVPGAARSVSAAAGLSAFVPAIMLQGIASNVPAGTHAVALRYQWTSGTGGDDVYYPGAQVQAIAVG